MLGVQLKLGVGQRKDSGNQSRWGQVCRLASNVQERAKPSGAANSSQETFTSALQEPHKGHRRLGTGGGSHMKPHGASSHGQAAGVISMNMGP